MSSSNNVRIASIKETVYGVTPAAGNFKSARFVSESLSGSPETTESALIRTDRQSSGQVVTGLTVGGAINLELAYDSLINEWLEGAMFNSWQTSLAVNADLTIATTGGTITRAAGDWNTDVRVGDIITLTGFSNSVNNTQVMVSSIDSATVIKFVGPEAIVDEVGTGNTFKVADYLEIGNKNTRTSFSLEKAFLDLTNKAINYRGQLVNTMNLNIAYGSIVSASFEFSGNDYEPVGAAVDFMTNGRTIDNAATTNPMNGSIDMPFIANDSAGTLDESTFCIQSVELNLNNNLSAQNCIGKAAPQDYSEGTAQITVNLSAYLADENWNLIAKKLSQDPIQFGFMVKNNGGYYGFYLPAVQLSFNDPQSQGQNQDVILNTSGVAKVGANGESALRIYKA